MRCDNFRPIQSGQAADDLLMLCAQKDAAGGRIENLGGGWWRLSDGSVIGIRDYTRMIGDPYCNRD